MLFRSVKYTQDGILTEKDTFLNEAMKYLVEAKTETITIAKLGKNKSFERIPIKFYRLSPEGEVLLKEQRDKENQERFEELEKKVKDARGIESAISEQDKNLKDVFCKVELLEFFLKNTANQVIKEAEIIENESKKALEPIRKEEQ